MSLPLQVVIFIHCCCPSLDVVSNITALVYCKLTETSVDVINYVYDL